MNSRAYKTLSQFLLLIVATFTLASCATNGSGFPQIADPPPFDYADGEELRSGMHQLAFALLKLDRALADEYEENPAFQQSVVDNLSDIERIGEGLQFGDLRSKHPFLLEGMEKFLADVERAHWDASRRTPRYYMAGRIAGACVSCHKANY